MVLPFMRVPSRSEFKTLVLKKESEWMLLLELKICFLQLVQTGSWNQFTLPSPLFLARLQGWLSVYKHLLNGSIDLDSILLFLPISLCCCCCFLFLSTHTVYVVGLMNSFCWHVALSVFLSAGLTFFLFSPFLGSLPCRSPHTHVGSRCTRLG